MTDPRFDINAQWRIIPPGRKLDTPLFSLAWQATQRWSEEIRQLKQNQQASLENENLAWITLADECFRLKKLYTSLAPTLQQSNLSQPAQDLALTVRRLEQALLTNAIEIVAPLAVIYSPELSEVMENVDQVTQPDIEEPIVAEVLTPIIKRANQVIRFGKAIIAIPEQN